MLGVAERTHTGIEQRVHPTMAPKSTAIAQVMGVTNASPSTRRGARTDPHRPGAGGRDRLGGRDIADVASGQAAPPFGRPVDRLHARQRATSATRAATTSASPCSTAPVRWPASHPDGGGRHLARKHRPAPPKPRRCGTRTASCPARRCRSCSSPTPSRRRRSARPSKRSARTGSSPSRPRLFEFEC